LKKQSQFARSENGLKCNIYKELQRKTLLSAPKKQSQFKANFKPPHPLQNSIKWPNLTVKAVAGLPISALLSCEKQVAAV